LLLGLLVILLKACVFLF